MIRRHVYYTGRVQGVNFRATTEMLARGIDVKGYVRNLDDGQVELLAEGRPDEVNQFLKSVSDRMGRYITDMQILDEPPQNKYDDFSVWY